MLNQAKCLLARIGLSLTVKVQFFIEKCDRRFSFLMQINFERTYKK